MIPHFSPSFVVFTLLSFYVSMPWVWATDPYEVTDLRFKIQEVASQPFGIEFTATFQNDDGTSMTVPGFYDGANQFCVRFSSPKSGKWRYTTKSNSTSLNGLEGEITVQPDRDGQKGGVVVDPQSSQRFAYENGDGYYPIAFECDWLFALDAENDVAIPRTKKFVDALADNGFNQVVMNVFAYDVDWKKDDRLDPQYDYGSPSVFPFAGNNEKPDHSTLNVEYFQRLDRVIEYLNQKGVVAHLMIYVWNKRVAWPEANSEADNRYFDYVVHRYQAYPNIVWDISKEALGYGHTDVNYITQRIERLREKDVYDRLITVHDYGYCQRFPENVDFVSVQLWKSELYSVMRNVCKNIPGKPILNIEHGGYEHGPYEVFNGNYTSPEVCLERAYQCVFAGTYPTHYWQGAAWNVIVPNIDALPAKDRPKLEYYRHMREFVDRYKLDRLTVSDQKSNAGFCLHDESGRFVYYVPRECEYFGLRLPKQHEGKTMTVTWFNPLTGEYGKPESEKVTQWPAVKKPEGDQFWLLVIELDAK
jgi:Protein of unknown function (DUF4038)/Domain of unknown function (DUF5060)